MSNEVFIKIIAEQIVSEVINQSESYTFEWLDNRIRELTSQVAGMGESHISTIRHLVNEEVKIYTNPTGVVATREERVNLITLERLNENGYYWPRFNTLLQKSISKQVAKSVNDDVNRICLQLPDPLQDDDFMCKGMVIGDVQAGKTNNYTGLINKTADAGYRLIIILTGVTEPLRSQTQKRLDKDFVGMESVASRNVVRASHQPIGVGKDAKTKGEMIPHSVTDIREDFKVSNSVRLQTHKTPVLVVTKKNHAVLKNILRWLESQKSERSSKFEFPTLIIDDEADNASVNTADEGEDPKAINHLIRSILSACSKVSYVAYTATPFANVFIDPDAEAGGMVDLFPSHFIVCLNPPSNYCGGKFFYAGDDATYEESKYVRKAIYDCESFIPLSHKSDHAPTAIPPSMRDAIASFFVAAAIKDVRREIGLLDRTKEKFDSCLINVSRFTAVQSDLAVPVQEAVDAFWSAAQAENTQSDAYQQLKKIFMDHYKRVVGVEESWAQVAEALFNLEKPVVKIVHSKTKDDLDYKSDDAPTKVIAIGGFKLSRGLTLEGLTVSYFYRRSMMYDTLMQMARWFGYRDGYRDLLRLYTTPDAKDWYAHITEASEELKRELIELEGVGEPRDFGIKVRSHEDSLIVTARNKMRTATEISSTISYADKLKETFFVDSRAEVNQKNLHSVVRFFDEAEQDVHSLEVNEKGSPRFLMLDSVPAAKALQLLRSLQLDWGNDWARTDRLVDYLTKHSTETFRLWDVAFQSSTEDANPKNLSERLKIGVQVRRPLTLARPRPVGPTMSHEIRHSLALGDNRKVSSTSIDYVGIPQDVLDEKPGLKKSGVDARRWKKDHRPNPLLIFHLIKLDLVGSVKKLEEKFLNSELSDAARDELQHQLAELTDFKNVAELDDFYLAMSISIPGNDRKYDGVSYQINKREYEERFGVFEYDE